MAIGAVVSLLRRSGKRKNLPGLCAPDSLCIRVYREIDPSLDEHTPVGLDPPP